MVPLLMVLFVVMVEREKREKQPKRRWWQRRKPINSLLTFAESGVENLPRATRVVPGHAATTRPPTEPALDLTPTRSSEPQHKKVVEVVPTTLVEREAQTAIRLQMPNKTTPQGIRAYGNDRFDCPIGRTLTREAVQRDWRHVPRVAISHLPIDDVTRLVARGAIVAPQPTSPRAEAKKGRPTPKRNRRTHGAR